MARTEGGRAGGGRVVPAAEPFRRGCGPRNRRTRCSRPGRSPRAHRPGRSRDDQAGTAAWASRRKRRRSSGSSSSSGRGILIATLRLSVGSSRKTTPCPPRPARRRSGTCRTAADDRGPPRTGGQYRCRRSTQATAASSRAGHGVQVVAGRRARGRGGFHGSFVVGREPCGQDPDLMIGWARDVVTRHGSGPVPAGAARRRGTKHLGGVGRPLEGPSDVGEGEPLVQVRSTITRR